VLYNSALLQNILSMASLNGFSFEPIDLDFNPSSPGIRVIDLCEIQYYLHNGLSISNEQEKKIKSLGVGNNKTVLQLKIAKIASLIDSGRISSKGFFRHSKEVPKLANITSAKISSIPSSYISSVFGDSKYAKVHSGDGTFVIKCSHDKNANGELCIGWGKMLNEMYLDIGDIYSQLKALDSKELSSNSQKFLKNIIQSNDRTFLVSKTDVDEDVNKMLKILHMEKDGKVYKIDAFLKEKISDLIKATPMVKPSPSITPSPTFPQKTQPTPVRPKEIYPEPTEEEYNADFLNMSSLIDKIKGSVNVETRLKMPFIKATPRNKIGTSVNAKVGNNPKVVAMLEKKKDYLYSKHQEMIMGANNSIDLFYRFMEKMNVSDKTYNAVTRIINAKNAIFDNITPEWKPSDQFYFTETFELNEEIMKELRPYLVEELGAEVVDAYITESGSTNKDLQVKMIAEECARILVASYEGMGKKENEIAFKNAMDKFGISELEGVSKLFESSMPIGGTEDDKWDAHQEHGFLSKQITDSNEFAEIKDGIWSHIELEVSKHTEEMPSESNVTNQNDQKTEEDTSKAKAWFWRFWDKLWEIKAGNITFGLVLYAMASIMFGLFLPWLMYKTDIGNDHSRVIEGIRDARSALATDFQGQPLSSAGELAAVTITAEAKMKIDYKNAVMAKEKVLDIATDLRGLNSTITTFNQNFPIQTPIEFEKKKDELKEALHVFKKEKLEAVKSILMYDGLNTLQGIAWDEISREVMSGITNNQHALDSFKYTTVRLVKEAVGGKTLGELDNLLIEKPDAPVDDSVVGNAKSYVASIFGYTKKSTASEALEKEIDRMMEDPTVKSTIQDHTKDPIQRDKFAENVRKYFRNYYTRLGQHKLFVADTEKFSPDEFAALQKLKRQSKIDDKVLLEFSNAERAAAALEEKKRKFDETVELAHVNYAEWARSEKFAKYGRAVAAVSAKLGANATELGIMNSIFSYSFLQRSKMFESLFLSIEGNVASHFSLSSYVLNGIKALGLATPVTNIIAFFLCTPLQYLDGTVRGIGTIYSTAFQNQQSSVNGTIPTNALLSIYGSFADDTAPFKWMHVCSMASTFVTLVGVFGMIMFSIDKYKRYKKDKQKEEDKKKEEATRAKYGGLIQEAKSAQNAASKIVQDVQRDNIGTVSYGYGIGSYLWDGFEAIHSLCKFVSVLLLMTSQFMLLASTSWWVLVYVFSSIFGDGFFGSRNNYDVLNVRIALAAAFLVVVNYKMRYFLDKHVKGFYYDMVDRIIKGEDESKLPDDEKKRREEERRIIELTRARYRDPNEKDRAEVIARADAIARAEIDEGNSWLRSISNRIMGPVIIKRLFIYGKWSALNMLSILSIKAAGTPAIFQKEDPAYIAANAYFKDISVADIRAFKTRQEDSITKRDVPVTYVEWFNKLPTIEKYAIISLFDKKQRWTNRAIEIANEWGYASKFMNDFFFNAFISAVSGWSINNALDYFETRGKNRGIVTTFERLDNNVSTIAIESHPQRRHDAYLELTMLGFVASSSPQFIDRIAEREDILHDLSIPVGEKDPLYIAAIEGISEISKAVGNTASVEPYRTAYYSALDAVKTEIYYRKN
jgi:hypothetical protein